LLQKLSDKLLGWVEAFVIMLPNLTLALLAIALAVPVSRWARAIAAATFGRITKSPPITNLAATLVRVLILILAMSFALELLKLDKTVTSLIVEEPIEVLYAEFGETTIKAQVLVWLNAGDEEHYRRSRSAAMIAVKRALDQRGVVLPVPQRTVELGPDFKRHSVGTALK
jgi:small-conductance mechanosensitive channel